MAKWKDRYKQGEFKPQNPEKYKGRHTPVYRSSYEQKFMLWADANENVIEWTSESTVIPYRNPLTNRISRYFVDNYVKMEIDGKIMKYLIEIKPSAQTKKPTHTKRKRKKTLLYETQMWAKNQAKWAAAKTWADKRGINFLILTEKELGIK